MKRFNPYDLNDVANVDKFIKERNERRQPMTPNNTQTETIIWHKYPEEKPTRDDYYYVCLGYSKERFMGNRLILWKDGKWLTFWITDEAVNDDVIVAWAEEPKGWKE
jgi:hypothetical protein